MPTSTVVDRFLAGNVLAGADDFTLVLDRERLYEELARLSGEQGAGAGLDEWRELWLGFCRDQSGKKSGEDTSFDFNWRFEQLAYRLNVSSAWECRAWSLTARRESKASGDRSRADLERLIYRPPGADEWEEKSGASTTWDAGSSYAFEDRPPALFSMKEISDTVHECVTCGDKSSNGFLLVCGPTGSGKSQLARALIAKFLNARTAAGPGRAPHLVAYEDPIESYFMSKGSLIDYTPRQKMKDAAGLEETLECALRQTPAVVYAGELRSDKDIARCVAFGGTGHFIVATAHAGSLVEAMEKILDACKCKGPSDRATIVPKIRGVVHMDRVECDPGSSSPSGRLSGLVPSLYRRTAKGMQDLVADGLASLLPFSVGADELKVASVGSISRTSVARALCRLPCQREALEAIEARRGRGQADEFARIRTWNGSDSSVDTGAGRRLVEVTLERDLYGR